MKTAAIRSNSRLLTDPRTRLLQSTGQKGKHIAKSASVTVFKLPSLTKPSLAVSPIVRSPGRVPALDRPNLSHFRLLRTIGTGTFSRVRLAVVKSTQEVVVIKVMSKPDIIKKRQVEHVRNERNILGTLKHPFLVQLKWAFQDRDNLYLVQEYAAGGELYRYLRKKGKLPMREVNFYAAEVVSALAFLHSRRVVYRDLKPENLLLTELGHIKLTDFGFAKQLGSEKTFTLCGTPEYLAPEVIQQRGHDFACDWWGLGILLFEMITGHAPFMDPNPFKLYEKIVNNSVVFPANFDSTAQSLVQGLLEKVAARRMGVNEVQSHSFFAGVSWQTVEAEGLVPPFLPTVRSSEDSSNFDIYPDEAEVQERAVVSNDLFPNFS